MIPCPHCHAVNHDALAACRACGKLLPTSTAEGNALTLPATDASQLAEIVARQAPSSKPDINRSAARRTLALDELFGGKDKLIIGRGNDCDLCLPHPSVSRIHALLERQPDRLRLHDLGSLNGVLVDGRRIQEPTELHANERVGIGPFLFSYVGGMVHTIDSSRSLRLEARGVEKVVPAVGGLRQLLVNINLALEPGEFVSLLGPSAQKGIPKRRPTTFSFSPNSSKQNYWPLRFLFVDRTRRMNNGSQESRSDRGERENRGP